MSRIDRRKFLAGSGVLLSLPMLDYFTTSAVAGPEAAPPVRLVILYFLQGMPLQYWTPTGTSSNYQLNDIFQESIDVGGGQSVSLADFKDDMNVISGVDCASATYEAGNAHNLAAGHSLIGTAMQPDGPSNDYTLSGGASIDHHISTVITPPTVAFNAMHLAINGGWEVCYTGPGQPVNRMNDPNNVVDALFGDFNNTDPQLYAKRRAQRQSVLDATKENIDLLRPKLGALDRERLDEYLTRIAAIEQKINATIGVGEQCSPLDPFSLSPSPYRDWAPQVDYFHPHYDPDIAAPPMIDCLVEALACDRTRVATLHVGDRNQYHWLSDGNGGYVQAPSTGDWHQDIVHAYWGSNFGDATLGDYLRKVNRWEHSLVAYLLHQLKSRQEGEGTLLDNTVVLCLNEFGAETHVHTNMPYIVAGGGGGTLKTGQWLQYSSAPHNRLLLSILRAFGIQDQNFGDPLFCSGGPLTELLV